MAANSRSSASASGDIVVRLVDTTGSNGTRQGSLTIVSDDADEPNTVVQLRGLWQVAPEGGNEPLFRNVIAAFGWTTNTGTGTLSSDIDAPASGEEVISARWKRADTTKPLDVRQLVAYHGCPGQALIRVAGAEFRHGFDYCQSALPLDVDNQITEASASPTSQFNVVIGGLSSVGSNGLLGVRFFPVRDRNGVLVPNSWIVIQDYVQSGCGTGAANCDFNDNMLLITNITPADSPTDPGGGTGGGVVSVPGSATTPSIVVTPSNNALAVTWDHPSAAKFELRHKTASSASAWKWKPATTNKSQTLTGLTNGTAYDVQVRILIGGTWQAWNTATATPGTSGPPANAAPVVNAGPDQTVIEGTTVTSPQRRPTTDSRHLRERSPPRGHSSQAMVLPKFTNAASGTSTVTFPATGSYVLQWTADDSTLASTDQVQITVLPASTPVPAPTVNPATGTCTGAVSVTTSSATPNSEIRYTTDGNDPTSASTLYTGAVSLTATTTVKARVYPTIGTESAVTTRTYTIQTPPPGGGVVSVHAAPQRPHRSWSHPRTKPSLSPGTTPAPRSFQLRHKTASSASAWKWKPATTNKSQTLTGLTNGTAYDVQVRILIGGTWQAWNTATATPGTSGPPANDAPVVNAGPDQTVIEGTTVTLAATATDDGLPDTPGAITTSWSQFSGNGLAQFTNAASGTSTVTFPATGSYVLQWTADDSTLASTDQVQITVLPASTPVPAPTVNPATGTYTGSVSVTMSSSTPNSRDPLHHRRRRPDLHLDALHRRRITDSHHHRQSTGLPHHRHRIGRHHTHLHHRNATTRRR